MIIWLIILILLLSFILIWKGSDWLTDSLVPLANKLGTSYIAVTTLIVSFVLSMPEIFSSIYTYFMGHFNIGLGVIIGSVIMNIGIGAGVSAMIKPLKVEKPVVLRDGIFLVIIAIVVLLLGSDLKYTRAEGWVLLLLFIPYFLNVWSFEKWRPKKSQKEKVQRIKKNLSLIGNLPIKLRPSHWTFLLGAGILLFGSYLFSFSLIQISEILAVPDLLIGLVIGAIGTGIPNIAAAVHGTLKGYEDAAITETFGSNIFTLLVTLGIIIILAPITIAGRVFYFDLTWMIVLNLLMVAFIFKGYKYKQASLTRFEGLVLLLFYLVLIVVNVWGF